MDVVLWITRDHPMLALMCGLGFFLLLFSIKPFLMWLGDRKRNDGQR